MALRYTSLPGLLRAQQLRAARGAATAAWLRACPEGSHGLSDQGPPGAGGMKVMKIPGNFHGIFHGILGR